MISIVIGVNCKVEGDTYRVTTMAIHHPDPPVVVVRLDDRGDSVCSAVRGYLLLLGRR
jgi:hypothetical protein